LAEVYSKEEVNEFVIQRLHLTPKTLGKTRGDVPSIIHDIGGLQYGGHITELFSRFRNFRSEWFDYWYEHHTLIDGHVLRGALRIVTANDYVFYFKATRSVSRRRTYHNCPVSLSNEHYQVLNYIERHGPLTPSQFTKSFREEHPQLEDRAKRLMYDLYNYGEIARIGRKCNRPLYQSIKKLPYKLDMEEISEKEAEKWLFLKSLSIYGPFTLKDIAHWIGWTLTETKRISNMLLHEGKITTIDIEDQPNTYFLRVKDLVFLDSLRNNLPEYSFIKILFNDDALLLGCYRRLKDFFGYHWRYPQLSEGIVWQAAILHGRELIGEAVVDMYTKSPLFKIQKLLLRKEFANAEVTCKIEDGFNRHAIFQGKRLQVSKPRLV
jgi:uncharacterized protein YcaQ